MPTSQADRSPIIGMRGARTNELNNTSRWNEALRFYCCDSLVDIDSQVNEMNRRTYLVRLALDMMPVQ